MMRNRLRLIRVLCILLSVVYTTVRVIQLFSMDDFQLYYSILLSIEGFILAVLLLSFFKATALLKYSFHCFVVLNMDLILRQLSIDNWVLEMTEKENQASMSTIFLMVTLNTFILL